MKKSFISLSVLIAAFIFCANSGECKTVTYYYNTPPVPIERNHNFYTANNNYYGYNTPYKVSSSHRKKPQRYTRNNAVAYNYNLAPYGYNNPYTTYTYKKPSIWQRIFNL